jgi:hypothetical protein
MRPPLPVPSTVCGRASSSWYRRLWVSRLARAPDLQVMMIYLEGPLSKDALAKVSDGSLV